jgi:hypothetical protein
MSENTEPKQPRKLSEIELLGLATSLLNAQKIADEKRAALSAANGEYSTADDTVEALKTQLQDEARRQKRTLNIPVNNRERGTPDVLVRAEYEPGYENINFVKVEPLDTAK